MQFISILVLAVLQGITEFLPVSSSGHLVVAAHLFGLQESSNDINIVLHIGTLASILVFYRRQIWRLLAEDRRAIPLLVVGSIPAAAIGFVIKIKYENLLNSLPLAGAMFPMTGLVLLGLASKREDGKTAYSEMTFLTAFCIGIFQAVALLPGLSRSGLTISGALFCGLKRESAATFSFLLAIPAILGASLLEAIKLYKQPPTNIDFVSLGIGAVVAFIVGYISLALLVKLVGGGKLYWFAAWLIPLGIGVIIWWLLS